MTKKNRNILLIVLGLFVAGGVVTAYEIYKTFYNEILETKIIWNFNREKSHGSHPTILRISGMPMYSGMIVRSVTQKKNGSTIVVMIHLALVGLAKPKYVGNFIEYEMTIPDSVNEVQFGRSGTPIWKRGTTLAPLFERR